MLGFPPVLKHVVPATSIRWLLPTFQLQFLDGASKRQRATADTAGQRGLPWFLASPTGDTLAGPPPALVISTCSETTLAALAVRRAGQSAGTKAIHVMGPAVDVTHFDACVLPRYIWPTFGKTGPKEVVRRIFRTDLHVNLITPERLQAASAEPVPAAFRDLQADRTVAVLVSGMPSGEFAFFSENGDLFLRQLKRTLMHRTKLMITLSHRTPEKLQRKIFEWEARLPEQDRERVYLWRGDGENPYEAMLALATDVVVLADSPMMVSEAICSGRRVYIAGLSAASGTLLAFHRGVQAAGQARVFRPSRAEPAGLADEGDEDVLCEGEPVVAAQPPAAVMPLLGDLARLLAGRASARAPARASTPAAPAATSADFGDLLDPPAAAAAAGAGAAVAPAAPAASSRRP